MVSTTSGNGNLMDEFEEAFQACLHALTKQESSNGVDKDEIDVEVQQTANKFIDVARLMEAFFLQKRYLISTLKPEMLLNDENQELNNEIKRKNALINKHYQRLEEWKAMLADTQQQQQQSCTKTAPGQNMIPEQRTVPIPSTSGGQIGSQVNMINSGNSMHPPIMQQQQQMMQLHQMQQMQKNVNPDIKYNKRKF
ncbi:mediator of RNA polymerase II transcription subunit 28 [Condylostylus longicornis]|uniref:mediator of RNA polymerase II transcription subunit 28 n=1 Tax=Condylostylus longicornis TaxID=2530218 RepID=UPI00244DB9BA|nr:mediator of RNA polymerase II transcription subunit 28 [Condylostylus longicornis]